MVLINLELFLGSDTTIVKRIQVEYSSYILRAIIAFYGVDELDFIFSKLYQPAMQLCDEYIARPARGVIAVI